MAKSTVQVYNLALGWLGGHQLPSAEAAWQDDSALGRLCLAGFPEVLRQAHESHEWSFAAKTQELSEKPGRGRDGCERRFALPSDCLRPIRLEAGALPARLGPHFIIEGRDLLTNQDAPRLVYTALIEDPAMWPPAFTLALSWGLAAFLATANNNDARMQQHCFQNYQIALAEAWANDLQMQNPRPEPSAWAAARHGGL